MTTLIILFVVLVLALLILPFFKALMKDREDLRKSPIEVRYKVLIDEINNAFLDGKGKTVYPVKENNKWLNLHSSDKANYLFQFNYSTGSLTVYLNYKYLQKELQANVPFYNVRNADIFTQKRMANEFIQKMQSAIVKHQQSIGIPDCSTDFPSLSSDNEDDPINLISSMYGELSIHQKRSSINLGYLIFAANGSTWSEYIQSATTRSQLNYLNIDWKECKSQLENEGESSVFSDLKNLEDGVYDTFLMFWLSLVVSEYGTNQARENKFIYVNERLGHSEEDVTNRIQKIEAMMKFFGQ